MKFFPESVARCAARIGTLTEFERIPNAVFETPLLFLYTKRGCIPHLSKDVLHMVTKEPHLLSISLPSIVTMEDAVKELNVPFSEFVSMKEYVNFLSIQDPAEATMSGFHQGDSISVWSRTGRFTITAQKYMSIVEAFKPDIYLALCDGDTNGSSPTKRSMKAMQRSRTLLEQCLEIHNASESLKSKGILGAVEGGFNLEHREFSINHLKSKPLAGFVIDGLHNNGPDVKNISTDQVRGVVQHTLNLLPPEKLRISMGSWNPVTLLDLIELGVDAFDSSYPYIITERAEALTFMCDHQSCNNAHLISLKDDRYKDDLLPICSKCDCVACQNHSRAYLHHLHHTREMLGGVLLTMHNMHHYLEFFKVIRRALKNGTFPQLQAKVRAKFPAANIASAAAR